jgi:hypothetical protein
MIQNKNPKTNDLDVPLIVRAQNRILRAKRKYKTWRGAANSYGLNWKYVYNLAVFGTVPKNPDLRRALKLPRVMPSEKKPKKKRENWRDALIVDLEKRL